LQPQALRLQWGRRHLWGDSYTEPGLGVVAGDRAPVPIAPSAAALDVLHLGRPRSRADRSRWDRRALRAPA